jgi:hypothetical protein
MTKKKVPVKTRKSPSAKASGSYVRKSLNFSAQEDNMLAKAFVNMSTNPIHGSGMKSHDFWDNAHQKWIELLATEGISGDIAHTSMALKLRFQRQIQKDMNQWNACHQRVCIENQSGLNNPASIRPCSNHLFKIEKTEFMGTEPTKTQVSCSKQDCESLAPEMKIILIFRKQNLTLKP